MSYLKANIFVPFHCFVQVFLSRKYSEKKKWSAYKFWKDHSLKNCTYTSVKRLLKRFKDSGTKTRKEGSG